MGKNEEEMCVEIEFLHEFSLPTGYCTLRSILKTVRQTHPAFLECLWPVVIDLQS